MQNCVYTIFDQQTMSKNVIALIKHFNDTTKQRKRQLVDLHVDS